MIRPTHPWRAFTLVEMLLALALTAVLLTIVSVTIGGIVRDSQRLETMRSQPIWLESVVRVIRQDLCEAESYEVTNDAILLHGHMGPPEQAGTPGTRTNDELISHDRVTIEYRVIRQDDVSWLVRRVTPQRSVLTNAPRPFELLCGGVQDIHLGEWQADDPDDQLSASTENQGANQNDNESRPVPGQMVLSITVKLVEKNANSSSSDRFQDKLSDQVQSVERLIVIR